MDNIKFVKPKKIWVRKHASLNEAWVQEQIAEDPSILGLGELILRDRERAQPRAGRLDLLLQDPDTNSRYEVEIQLGKTDESHIIRTIEYWDVERKRYPQYDHCAVIVAEDITARFLNVISLFNGTIPLIAIQMNVLSVGENVTIVFTKVLDVLTRGSDDDEVQETTDRAYWEKRGATQTVALADRLLAIVQVFDPDLELKYNKFYIGLAKAGQPNNFVVFRAKKGHLRMEPRVPQSEELSGELDESGLDLMDYDARWGRYRIRLTGEDIETHSEIITRLLGMAYEGSGA